MFPPQVDPTPEDQRGTNELILILLDKVNVLSMQQASTTLALNRMITDMGILKESLARVGLALGASAG